MRARLALLLVLVALGACGVPTEDDARALDPSAAPYQVVTRDRVAPPAGSYRVAVFLVRDDALVPVPRRVAEAPTPAGVLEVLSAGPTKREQDEGLTSGLPLDGDATVVGVEGGVVRVALPAPSETSTRSDSVLGFGQLVVTLTALPAVNGVVFERDGQPLQVPRADGSLSTGPLGRVDYRELIDPV